MVSPPGVFFFLMFLSLLIFCFSYYNYLALSTTTAVTTWTTHTNQTPGHLNTLKQQHRNSCRYVFFWFCLLFYYINTFLRPSVTNGSSRRTTTMTTTSITSTKPRATSTRQNSNTGAAAAAAAVARDATRLEPQNSKGQDASNEIGRAHVWTPVTP